MRQENVKDLITFIGGLLQYIYEFPGRLPKKEDY